MAWSLLVSGKVSMNRLSAAIEKADRNFGKCLKRLTSEDIHPTRDTDQISYFFSRLFSRIRPPTDIMTDVQKVLITGANGYLGTHIVKRALESGHSVRGVVRSSEKASELGKLFASYGDRFEAVVVSDVLAGDFSQALTGVSAVIHTASPVTWMNVKDPKELLDPAIEGTLNVLRASTIAGVNRFILTSSIVSTMNLTLGGPWVDKTYGPEDWNPVTYEDAVSGKVQGMLLYAASKALQEKAAWDFAKQHPELKLTSINPTMIFGPIMQPLSSVESLQGSPRLFWDMIAKNVIYPDSIPLCCDVRDAAAVHVEVLGNEATFQKRILIGKEKYTMWKGAKLISEKRTELAGRLPQLPETDPAKEMPICNIDSSQVEELGIKFRTFEESLLEMIDQLLALDKLKGETRA
ncbi:3-beta hydroxysteroid dehydrogenase isomerase family protein [Moniliophthora roreri]|nr:3-beta hydroxysteroid dehydrogenase isomerase family protein [Moniliophthora roreri]